MSELFALEGTLFLTTVTETADGLRTGNYEMVAPGMDDSGSLRLDIPPGCEPSSAVTLHAREEPVVGWTALLFLVSEVGLDRSVEYGAPAAWAGGVKWLRLWGRPAWPPPRVLYARAMPVESQGATEGGATPVASSLDKPTSAPPKRYLPPAYRQRLAVMQKAVDSLYHARARFLTIKTIEGAPPRSWLAALCDAYEEGWMEGVENAMHLAASEEPAGG